MDSTIDELIQLIDDFSAECEQRQHTDTGDAWDLLRTIRGRLDAIRRDRAGSHDPTPAKRTSTETP